MTYTATYSPDDPASKKMALTVESSKKRLASAFTAWPSNTKPSPKIAAPK
jgi:hypothetical protein